MLRGEGAVWREDQVLNVTVAGRPRETWWTYGYSPIEDEFGEVAGVLIICHDVTNQNEAVQELYRERRRLFEQQATLKAQLAERARERDRIWTLSGDLLSVSTMEGQTLAVNPAWTKVLGWTHDEVLNQPYVQLVHPDDFPRLKELRSELLCGIPAAAHIRMRHKDGSYRWIAFASTVEDGKIYSVGRDVTPEREQAAALRRAEEALRQSQKLEAVGQLTGGMAHDFNNILQGILGSLDLMRKRLGPDGVAKVSRYLDAATQASTRAAELTHRLLAFSRRQPLDPRPVDSGALIGSMAELLRRTLGEKVEVRLQLEPGTWPLLCDHNQLESALLNLAINARDAMPDGGALQIATANIHRESDGGEASCDFVRLSVSDTGVGMTPEVMAQAFDPFFTTKPQGQGTGLGLSMVYGFVKQSGGSVELDSRAGEGTTVHLTFPRYSGRFEAAAPAPAEDAANRGAGEVVLVVEDDPVVRDLVVEELKGLGYRTLQAPDGPAGLQIANSRARIDLLVSDIGLPGLDGYQLAKAARQKRPELKVLFMTGYAQQAAGHELSLEAGMALITKPFDLPKFAQRLRSLMAEEPAFRVTGGVDGKNGGRGWDRTCDPLDVNEVLSR